MYFLLCKYHAEHHVDTHVVPLKQGAIWRNDDITVLLIIYATISD